MRCIHCQQPIRYCIHDASFFHESGRWDGDNGYWCTPDRVTSGEPDELFPDYGKNVLRYVKEDNFTDKPERQRTMPNGRRDEDWVEALARKIKAPFGWVITKREGADSCWGGQSYIRMVRFDGKTVHIWLDENDVREGVRQNVELHRQLSQHAEMIRKMRAKRKEERHAKAHGSDGASGSGPADVE